MVNHEYSRTNEFQTKRVYATFLTIEYFDQILSRTFQEFFGPKNGQPSTEPWYIYLIYLTTEMSILFKLTSFVNSSFIKPS